MQHSRLVFIMKTKIVFCEVENEVSYTLSKFHVSTFLIVIPRRFTVRATSGVLLKAVNNHQHASCNKSTCPAVAAASLR